MQKIFFISVILFFVACAAQLRKPTAFDVEHGKTRWSDYDSLQLANGYTIFITSCSHCHNLHLPQNYSERNWNQILPKMIVKSKLDTAEAELVRKYILIMAADTSKKSK